MLNLDTHILIDALSDELSKRERKLLSESAWSISAIVLWELAKLVQLDRIELDLTSPQFTRALSRIQIWPITLDVATRSTQLDFRSDPADEIIAATSLVHRVPLLTRDKRIAKSRLVPLA
jgi:PIN domain nuclease of toxin-antitoxin system